MARNFNFKYPFSLWSLVLPLIWVLLLPIKTMAAMDYDQLETSIVLLVIKTDEETIYQDPFFEILDLDGYQLVPINNLASKLGLAVSYHRSEGKVVVSEATNGHQAEVYLKEGVYRIGDILAWPDEPPLLLNGDFYISIRFLEFVAKVKVNWNPRYQELTIVSNRLQSMPTREEKSGLEKRSGKREQEPLPKEGPSFSLGSIRYELILEERHDESGSKNLDGLLKLRADGRAGDWALSLGGNIDYDFYERVLDPDLTLLRAKYNEDDELIILGNSHIELEKTIGKKDLWGVLYMNPDRQLRKQVVAYTDLSGQAEEGDKVQLYLNNHLFKTQTVSAEGSFFFRDVPLRIRRVNLIRIVIQKKNGELLETIQKVSASPRLVKANTNEILVATGLYKRDNKDTWEGMVVGLRNRVAATDQMTFDLEVSKVNPYRETKQTIIGTDAGLAFKVNKDLICTVDWMLGGASQTSIKSAMETSLLYCLENGCLEAIIFYIPSVVSEGVNVSPGRGGKILGALEFKEDICLEAEGYLIDSPPDMFRWSLKGGTLTLTKKSGKYRQNSLSGGVKREWKTEETEEGSLEAVETGAIVKYTVRERRVGATVKGALTSTDLSLDNSARYNIKALLLQNDLTISLSDSLLVGLTLDSLGTWFDDHYERLQLEEGLEVKWGLWGDTIITGVHSAKGTHHPEADSIFRAEEVKTGLSIQHFFPNRLTLVLEANRIFQHLPNGALNGGVGARYLYTTAGLSLNYRFSDDTGRIFGKVGYRSPVGSRNTPQWSGGLSFQKFLPSELMLKLEFERVYSALWDETPEDLIRLSVGQAFGFANGETRAFRYSDEDNVSIIKGVVYLDENGNGQFDEWERRLSGIVISVDGRRAITNANGEYVFNFLRPGIYRVGFNPRSLPADYTPVTDEQLIRIRENENFFLDFGVTLNGSICGQVFIDANANGQMDKDEKPLDWVGIILDDGAKKTFTSQDGGFFFEGVFLGDHTVSIDLESLPTDLRVAGEGVISLLITEETLDIADLLFPLVFKFVD